MGEYQIKALYCDEEGDNVWAYPADEDALGDISPAGQYVDFHLRPVEVSHFGVYIKEPFDDNFVWAWAWVADFAYVEDALLFKQTKEKQA